MPRYTDGIDWFDCTEHDGLHFTVTAAGKIALVELCSDPVVINPPGDVAECGQRTVSDVTELENARSCYCESTQRSLHVFDIYLDGAPAIFCVLLSGRRIRRITRYN